jgi:hypothetical protein
MKLKFCPRIVENSEAKDNGGRRDVAGSRHENKELRMGKAEVRPPEKEEKRAKATFCLQIAHIAHIGITEAKIFWQIGGV